MARPTPELIDALRRTAKRLQNGDSYQWGHMGGCNCGHLAQELTKLSRDDIHRYAMQRFGDWNDQVDDYCVTSQMPMDLVISEMLEAGLSIEDLKHLEKLDDKSILMRLEPEKRYLKHNFREDVITYLSSWANLLEEQLLERIKIPSFKNSIMAF